MSAALQRFGLPAIVPDEGALAAQLSRLPLRDLAALDLGVAEGRASLTLEQLAQAVLTLPTSDSKLSQVERAVVAHALAMSDGNKSAAARLLGMDRKAFARKARRARAKA